MLIHLLLACRSPDPGTADRAPGPLPDPAPQPSPTVPVPTGGREVKPAQPDGHPAPPWDCAQIKMTRAWELGSGADDSMELLAPMPGGDMIVVGDAMSPIDFGNGVVGTPLNADDLVVARIQPDGNAVWAKILSGGFIQTGGLAVDPAGRIAVTGEYNDPLIFDAGTPNATVFGSSYLSSGFVAILDASGVLIWARTIQGDGVNERADAVAFDADGSVWATGSFDAASTTVSFGEPDAVTITGGDADPNGDDAWLAHFDAAGGLLGVGWSAGDLNQRGVALAARPTGGVDAVISHGSDTFVDLAGVAHPLPDEGSSLAIVRLDRAGAFEDCLALPAGSTLQSLGYAAGDLVAALEFPLAATVPAWDDSPGLYLENTAFGALFDGLVTWTGGQGPVRSELVGSTKAAFFSASGQAIGAQILDDQILLPETAHLEVDESEFTQDSGRPSAVAWDPSGTWVCAVDIEARGEPLANNSVLTVALDEVGGMWVAGGYRESTFTVEAYPGGPAAAEMEATLPEDDQGFLVRWQLWPAPAPPPPPPASP